MGNAGWPIAEAGDRLRNNQRRGKNQALGRHQQIYAAVNRVPFGRVDSYGQVVDYVAGCTARMAGYAMTALPDDTTVPFDP